MKQEKIKEMCLVKNLKSHVNACEVNCAKPCA